STKNTGRDKKIVDNFFRDVKISGKVTAIKKNMLITEMVMKGKKVKVPMKYTLEGSKLSATGTIDVFDFMMHSNLDAINKACKALHEGKTWNDVNIELKTDLTSC
ncbi:YceI-like domain protein, partial [Bacteriovorax sp. DB6_IX]